ncbi:MAG: SPASM domain-containing protein [Prevotellaceae bacterium]|jgi:uncharacterized protein|nr:SPASM domain-containing protein [Prevotellaceae bacterium]
MKISNYTFLFANSEGYFVFNALSKAFLQINKECFDVLSEKKNNNEQLNKQDIDTELFNELVNRLFICENYKDEFLIYKSANMNIRNKTSAMSITIAPTMDCCFSCFYCFEKGNHTKTYITDEVMNAIVKNISNRKELQYINLTWFGGEPLMAIDKMRIFYHKFRPLFKGNFSSNIITTAFHIDENVIDILKEIEVTSMQITLDGTEKTHNSIKFTDGCDNAFQKVISNIDLLVEKYPEIQINLRINTTKTNVCEYVELHKFITDRYKNYNIFMTNGYVMNRNNSMTTIETSTLLSNDDCSKLAIDLWKNHKILTHWLMYDNYLTFECAVRNRNSLIVDPEGYTYQCWEVIGNKKHAIGRLDKEGNITEINQKELNRNLYGADPFENAQCKKCSYLPMCSGGCPYQRIENEFECGKNELCTTYKNHISEWLTTYLELKKLGYFSKPKEEENEK